MPINSGSISPISEEILSQTDESLILKFTVPGIEYNRKLISNEEHTQLRIPNASFILEKGMPELPKYAASVIIPDNGIMDINVLNIDYEYLKTERIVPSKGNLKRNVNPDNVPYEYGEIYTKDEWYPQANTELSAPFIIRDYRGVTVTLYPVQYNAVKGEIRVIKSVTIEIVKTAEGGINTIPSYKKISNAGFNEIYRDFFINYNLSDKSKYTLLTDAVGNMLIISASQYMDNLDEFIFWKKKMGINVELVNVDDIGNNSTNIKNYIQNKYDTDGLTYVILVGNATDVATISGDYDETSDPVYAYLAGGDDYQDCYIGRFSTNTEADLDEQLIKTVTYERYPQDGADWYSKALGTATEEGSPTDYERLSWVNDSLLAYTYTYADNLNEAINSTDADVLNAINDGRSILNHIGHGDVDGFGTASAFWVTNTDIGTLSNTDKWPFIFFVACLVGDFDAVTMCCSEAFMWQGTTSDLQGAVAVYGASVLQSWIPPTHAQLHAMGLLKREVTTTVGGLSYNGSMYMQEVDGDLEMLQTWHIFGDPSLDLFTDTPDTLDVIHDEFVPTGPYSFTVDVYDDDGVTPINNALVCLWGQQDTLIHETGYTSGGTVNIPIDAANPGDTIYITVTKHNYKPYENYIVVGVGIPSKPVQVSYYDYARVPDLNPTFRFLSTDEDGDDLRYKIFIDTDNGFSNPDSFVTGLFTENTIASYTLPVSLSDNTTYYWKVRVTDPSGSAFWTGWSPIRTFTIGTDLGASNCSWYQTTAEQYECCTINNLRIIGDTLQLNPSYAGADTLIGADFESGMPSGWSVSGASGSAVWGVGTGGTAPPAYGTAYARIVYPSSGPNPSGDTDILTAPINALTPGTTILTLDYGYGFDPGTTDEMICEMRFFNGSWGSWTNIATYTVNGTGSESIDLSSYLPADSVQVRWSFISPGGKNGQDGAIDNVMLIGEYDVVSNSGSITSPPIIFDDLNNTYGRTMWGNVNWKQSAQADSVLFSIEYMDSGVWSLVPDGVLAGNSAGIGGTNAIGYGNHEISAMNTSTYDTIRIIFNIYRKLVKSGTEPALNEIEVGNMLKSLTGVQSINLTAELLSQSVIIRWDNCSDCSGNWIVQRSSNNSTYEEIGRIRAIESNYTYIDKSPLDGEAYYRIVSIGDDGSQTAFGPVKIIMNYIARNDMFLQNSTVFSKELSISYSIADMSDVEFSVFDISGRMIEHINFNNAAAGQYVLSINTENMMKGTYFIRFNTQGFSKMAKFINIK